MASGCAAGSAIVSSTLQENGITSQSGERIILVGLAIQLAAFALFVCLTLYIFQKSRQSAGPRVPIQVFLCMWGTLAFIAIRNIYRIVEIAIGWAGYLNTHEVYFYTLDALPIFLAFLVFIALPYGRYLSDAPVMQEGPKQGVQADVSMAGGERPKHEASAV